MELNFLPARYPSGAGLPRPGPAYGAGQPQHLRILPIPHSSSRTVGSSLIAMYRSRTLAWGSVGVLVLLVAGAAWVGVLNQSPSASAQLTEAYSATNNASSLVVTTSSDPSERSV
jgi:hypothetical protein